MEIKRDLFFPLFSSHDITAVGPDPKGHRRQTFHLQEFTEGKGCLDNDKAEVFEITYFIQIRHWTET